MKRILLYPRLALQGMSKNRALYLPYLLMSILMAALYYILCYLSTPNVITAMDAGETTKMVMEMGMMVIGIFSCIFLYYCNTFLTNRRMKEYGLYHVLGMQKRHISYIMLWEAAFSLLAALVPGLIAGVSLSRLSEVLLIRILNVSLTEPIFLSPMGLWRTAEVFGFIFLLILVTNLLRMGLSHPLNMLRAEKMGQRPPKGNGFVALMGIVLLGGGYFLALTVRDPMTAIVMFFLAVLLVILGTYLLFISGSVTLCRLLKKNKAYYYKTNHFISLSSMAFRMKRNGAGLASICILCTMVLVTLSSTLCLYSGTEKLVQINTPGDLNLYFGVQGNAELSDERQARITKNALDAAQEEGFAPENVHRVHAFSIPGRLLGNSVTPMLQAAPKDSVHTIFYLYPLSLYEEYTGLSLSLAPGELGYYPLKSNYDGDTLSLFGSEYTLQKLENAPPALLSLANRNNRDSILLFAEDDDALKAQLLSQGDPENLYSENAMYLWFDVAAEREAQEVLSNTLSIILTNVLWQESREPGQPSGIRYTYRAETAATYREQIYGLFGGLFFIGLLLGGAFSLAAVLIIYYKQISEGYEDAERFHTMQRVGLSHREIQKSIHSQVLTVFFAPLILSGLHLLFALPMVNLVLRSFGMYDAGLFYGVSALCYLLFGLLYMGVYFITARTYYKIVK